jgi:hypothetical protein
VGTCGGIVEDSTREQQVAKKEREGWRETTQESTTTPTPMLRTDFLRRVLDHSWSSVPRTHFIDAVHGSRDSPFHGGRRAVQSDKSTSRELLVAGYRMIDTQGREKEDEERVGSGAGGRDM